MKHLSMLVGILALFTSSGKGGMQRIGSLTLSSTNYQGLYAAMIDLNRHDLSRFSGSRCMERGV